MRSRRLRETALIILPGVLLVVLTGARFFSQSVAPAKTTYEFNDSHFHLTNYIQEGISIRDFLQIMGTTTGRSVLFGIPVQQEWSYRVSGDNAPKYYLDTDAPLYYYSFTDAQIAMAYLSLSPRERMRFDPLITGFNPADMYAADHIRRVLQTFPGVFCGIGEFSIHKEFVTAKVAGGSASLYDPALDRILDMAEEAGLVVLIHNDVDTPFADPATPPAYLEPLKALFRRHPKTTIIWAHMGLGRVVRPINNYAAILEDILKAPDMSHVMFDISWDEVAKYLVGTDTSAWGIAEPLNIAADLINRYPDRILFGTDSVAPKDQDQYLKTYHLYDPLWALLTKDAGLKVRKANYERIFDEAAKRVRIWEARQLAASTHVLPIAR
jgi:predicted TIM-barrel fold metal-dependent hydrolase